MTDARIVAIRLGRRAIGVVSLVNETYEFTDSRYLPSRKDSALAAGEHYVIRLLEQLSPGLVALYAPTNADGITRGLLQAVGNMLQLRSVPTVILDRASLLEAFGVSPLRTARQLQEVVQAIWSQAADVKRPTRAFVVEAAASALVAESRAAIGDLT